MRSGDTDHVVRITTAGENAAGERDTRVRRYVISMTIRTLCFVGTVITPSPWRWILLAGAVFLPYFAVIGANAVHTPQDASLLDGHQERSSLPGGHQ